MDKELDGTYYFYNEEVNGENQTNMIFEDKETEKKILFTNVYPISCNDHNSKPLEGNKLTFEFNIFPVTAPNIDKAAKNYTDAQFNNKVPQ